MALSSRAADRLKSLGFSCHVFEIDASERNAELMLGAGHGGQNDSIQQF